MDWSAIWQTIVASLISAGIIGVVFRVVFERGVEHVFARRLKEYESQLQERTALRTTFGEQRLDGYRNLIAEIRHTRRTLRECFEADPSERMAAVDEFHEATGNMQETLYNNALVLQEDGLYLLVHSYKVGCRTLAKSLRAFVRRTVAPAPSADDEDEREWRDFESLARRLLDDGEDVATALQTQVEKALQRRE
jgi:hypothetical protein